MFRFTENQEVYDLNGVKIGGQPGEYPTVMVGSIFYEGQKLVEDSREGDFDEERAEELLKKEEELSEDTGLPRMTDIVSGFEDALIKYIDFVGEKTSSPFLIDGTTSSVRIPAVEHVEEVGLAEKAIYNSISPDCDEEEIEVLGESEIDAAILLCYNPKNPTIEGRMESLEKSMELAEEAGIEKKLVDPSVLDLPDPGPASKMIYKVKEQYGLPAGCGAHNAVDQWRDRREMDSESYKLRTAIANSFPIVLGADFALYGPIDSAERMFDGCSLTDAYVSYSMRMDEGIRPEVDDSPISKIFRPRNK